jgi:hypothetical protein|nr:MAG TPA: hypothetical protein [Caudoviricetes sp.]
MAKFDAYPKADTVLPDDLLIMDGTRGTKTVKASEAIYKFLEPIPQMHKTIWRGKNLGSRYTSEQQAAVANGTLTDIWLGDYWEADGIRWTIVDFEAANQTMQDLPSTYLTIMPDRNIGRAEMLTGESSAAMQDTHIYKHLDGWQLYKFEAVFGASHILEHIVSFEGAWETGSWEAMRIGGPTGHTRIKKKIVLPTEIDWFGTHMVSTTVDGQWSTQTTSTKQFAAFRYGWTPKLPDDFGIWLHSRASVNYFGCVKKNEGMIMSVYSVQHGVCPYVFVR